MLYGIYKILLYVCLLLLLLEQFNICAGKRNRSVYHMLMTYVTIVAVIGFIIVASTDDLYTAILGNKLTYIAGCLLPVVTNRMGAELCRLKLKRRDYLILAALGGVVLLMAWTPGYNDWYYKNVTFETVGNVAVLKKEYGFLHIFYYIYLLAYMAFSIRLLVKSIKNRRAFRNKTAVIYVASWASVLVVYFVERIFDSPVSFVPFAMTMAVTVFTFQFRRVNLLDMDRSLIDVAMLEQENGYIVFDKHQRITVVNERMHEFFPETREFGIDSPVSDKKLTLFYENVYLPFLEDGRLTVNKIKVKGKTLKVEKKIVKTYSGKIINGYLLKVTDISDEERYAEMLLNYRERLERDIQAKTEKVEELRHSVITGIACMIESRDMSTGEHVRRASDIVKIFTKKLWDMGYINDRDFVRRLNIASSMHDLGKIAVPDVVLRKQGKYTPEEFDVMKQHARYGAVIVRKVLGGLGDEEFANLAANVAEYHHERYGGHGYPMGLAGTEIPLEARIMALADVFDALVSKRCYKDAYSFDTAFDIINDSIGTQFDPTLGQIFLTLRPEIEDLYNGYALEAGGRV